MISKLEVSSLKLKRMPRVFAGLGLWMGCALSVAAQGAEVPMIYGFSAQPETSVTAVAPLRSPVRELSGDVAGELGLVASRYEDTFAAIGNRHSLGFLEMVKANPGIDPWLPGEGTQVTLPTMYVMPDAPRDGIVINLAEYRLYYFRGDGKVQVFPVGIGRDSAPSPLTLAEVTMRLKSPAWYPPESVRAEHAAEGDILPRVVPPGPDNPLGDHALLLSEKGYLIHGTNKKFGIGMAVSHGCFRMYNEDIAQFAYTVDKGTKVHVVQQPVKLGMSGRQLWLEVHRADEEYPAAEREKLWQLVSDKVAEYSSNHAALQLNRAAIELAVDQADGLPRLIGEQVVQSADARVQDAPKAASGEQPVNYWF